MNASFKKNRLSLILSMVATLSVALVGCNDGGQGKKDDPKPDDPIYDNVYDVKVAADFDVTSSNFIPNFKDEDIVRQDMIFETSSKVDSITATYGTVKEITEPQTQDDSDVNEEEVTTKRWSYQLDLNLLKDHKISLPINDELYLTGSIKPQKFKVNNFAKLDEYVPYQWHLYNYGANKLNRNPHETQGVDTNAIYTYLKTGVTGKDNVVVVYDGVVNFDNPDLKDRKLDVSAALADTDLEKDTNSTFDVSKDSEHGSAVSGIIAASKNEQGVMGIAPNTKLISVNKESESIYQIFEKLNKHYINVSGLNASIGYNYPKFLIDYNYILTLESAKAYKAIIVTASGNEGDTIVDDAFINPLGDEKLPCLTNHISCSISQNDPSKTSHESILVGGINSLGHHNTYANSSSNLWVSGITGGTDDIEKGGYILKNNIVTTFYGLPCSSISKNVSQFTRDTDCNYTDRMNGTSAATPMVSGVVSLIKEVNPDLNIYQVKYILAQSAKNDLTMSTLKQDPIKSKIIYNEQSNEIVAHDGWQTNKANMRFNNDFGFGLPDAFKAVQIAKAIKDDDLSIIGEANFNKHKANLEKRADESSTLTYKTPVNSSKCNYNGMKEGLHEYECDLRLTNVEDNEGNDVSGSNTSYQIEAFSFKIGAIKLKYNGSEDPDFCGFDGSKHTDDITTPNDIRDYYNKYSTYQVKVTRGNETSAIVKPYSAFFVPLTYPSDTIVRDFYANQFYLEDLNSNTPWKITIKSRCTVDVNYLNDKLEATVYAYKA